MEVLLLGRRWRTALVVPEGERIAVGDRLAPHEAEKQTFRYRRDVSYRT